MIAKDKADVDDANHHLLSLFRTMLGSVSNRMQLSTSVLRGATACLTSTTQLLGNTIPLG